MPDHTVTLTEDEWQASCDILTAITSCNVALSAIVDHSALRISAALAATDKLKAASCPTNPNPPASNRQKKTTRSRKPKQ